MNFYKKNHWYNIFITVFKLIKSLWPVMIFLAVKFNDDRVFSIAIFVTLILGFSILKWYNTIITIEDEFLIYIEGAIFKEELVVPLKNISFKFN